MAVPARATTATVATTGRAADDEVTLSDEDERQSRRHEGRNSCDQQNLVQPGDEAGVRGDTDRGAGGRRCGRDRRLDATT